VFFFLLAADFVSLSFTNDCHSFVTYPCCPASRLAKIPKPAKFCYISVVTFNRKISKTAYKKATMEKNGQAAAFYDLEGTLVSTNLVHTLAFYARRQQGLFQTIKKSAATLVKLPLFGAADFYSRNVFNELFFQSYRGESEDRLRYFSEQLFEDVLKPAIFDGTPELIAQSKKIGQD
jgi:hypothetical protein